MREESPSSLTRRLGDDQLRALVEELNRGDEGGPSARSVADVTVHPRSAGPSLTGEGPDLVDPTVQAPEGATAELADRLAAGLAEAWRAGRHVPVEALLDEHTEVAGSPRAAARLIYEEICLRQELGLVAGSTDLLDRFPRYRDQLGDLLDGFRQLDSGLDGPPFPQEGELFEDVSLLSELGRGGAGRVFLATQAGLSDRPVVLKVTRQLGGEHLALARLQHTHIVPLYWARDLPDRGLRVLCMPYLGHATFARILGALKGRPPASRTGADLVGVIRETQAEVPVELPARGPGIDRLARDSYEQAVCRVGACLAQALEYAHERGLVHLDVKPSNVLIAADGTPMLLDFHLAQGPIRPDVPSTEHLIGGTPTYMSPEQAEALADTRSGRRLAGGVDERSDVYSLGLLLFEALGGPVRLAMDKPARRLRRANPGVSPGLAAVVARCLAADPRARYPDAGALADDLRRHLASRPLLGVSNRNLRERWRKWRRRRPHALRLAATGLAAVVTVSLAVAVSVRHWDQRLRDAGSALSRVPKVGPPEPGALRALERSLAVARETPGGGDLAKKLALGVRSARRAEAAGRLNRISDQIRLEVLADPPNRDDLRALNGSCREVWTARGLLLDDAGAPLDPGLEQRIRDDLLDLVTLSADLGVRLAPAGEEAEARRDALRRLDEVEAVIGPRRALDRTRQELAEALGLADLARAAAIRVAASGTRSAGDFYDLGVSLLRRGDLGPAAEALGRASALKPQAFWPNFFRGRCAAKRSRHLDAVEAFSTCLALDPGSAPCYAHRSKSWEALGHLDRAREDLDRALTLDPRLPGVLTNRGIIKLREGRPSEAIADLTKALDLGEAAGTAHYHIALAYLRLGDRARARASALAALRVNPGHASARTLFTDLDP